MLSENAFLPPGIPVDRVSGMLKKVGTAFKYQTIELSLLRRVAACAISDGWGVAVAKNASCGYPNVFLALFSVHRNRGGHSADPVSLSAHPDIQQRGESEKKRNKRTHLIVHKQLIGIAVCSKFL